MRGGDREDERGLKHAMVVIRVLVRVLATGVASCARVVRFGDISRDKKKQETSVEDVTVGLLG